MHRNISQIWSSRDFPSCSTGWFHIDQSASQPISSQQWALLSWQPGWGECSFRQNTSGLQNVLVWFPLSCPIIKAADWSPTGSAAFQNKFTVNKNFLCWMEKLHLHQSKLCCSASTYCRLIGQPADGLQTLVWAVWKHNMCLMIRTVKYKTTDYQELQSNMSHVEAKWWSHVTAAASHVACTLLVRWENPYITDILWAQI